MRNKGYVAINTQKLLFIKWFMIAVFFSLLVIANLRASGSNLIKIPFTLEENYPILSVKLNNKATPLQILFDSGLTGISLALPDKTVNDLKINKLGKTMIEKTTFTHEPLQFEAIDIKAFQSGGFKTNDIDDSYEMPEIWGYCDNRNCEHDGVVGLHFFRKHQYNILVDYQNQELTLVPFGTASDIFRGTDYIQSIEPLHIASEHTFNNVKVHLNWDTGASQNLIAKAGLLADKYTVNLAPGIDCIQLPIQIGKSTLPIQFMNTKEHVKLNDVNGFIGYNFFMEHKVFFDLENQRLYIQS